MTKQPKPAAAATKSMADLYAEYKVLAGECGIDPKPKTGFKNKLAMEAAIKYLSDSKAKPTTPKGKTDSPLPVAGNYVKLTPAMRARLRAISAKSGVKHQWGDRWQLTQADLDRLLKAPAKSDAAAN